MQSFIVFPLVGAVIGAITNDIAIKMLFRPYLEKRFLGFRLPFTPGVIPSQRNAIAKNIAQTFEKNLISGDDIHQVMTGENVRKIITAKVDEMFSGLGMLAAMLGGFKPKIIDKILEGIEDVGKNLTKSGGDLHIGEKIEEKINEMDIVVLEEMVLSVARKQLQHITFFGAILGFVIGLVQATLNFFLN